MSALLQQVHAGATLAGRPRHMTLPRVLALSGGPLDKPGWPDRNLHTDQAAAAAAGLDGLVVSGTQWEGHLAGFLVEVFGLAWFEGGEFNVKIPRSVRLGDTLRPMLRCESMQLGPEGTRYELAVWCENGAGEPVLAGTASCTVPAAAKGAA